MKDRRVTVPDEGTHSHFTVPYEAIVPLPPCETQADATASFSSTPPPPPEIASRGDFRVRTRVSFTDQSLQHRVGRIVRIN